MKLMLILNNSQLSKLKSYLSKPEIKNRQTPIFVLKNQSMDEFASGYHKVEINIVKYGFLDHSSLLAHLEQLLLDIEVLFQ